MKATNIFKKFSKSKTPDPSYRGWPNHGADYLPPSSYAYQPPQLQPQPQPQPQLYNQLQVCQHQQPMQLPMSPCLHQCQPQQHVIQSPQQSQMACAMQTQYRNSVIESRTADNSLVMNNQAQLQQPQPVPMPIFHANQIQPLVNAQSPRYTDNLYHNQMSLVVQQQQQQQQQLQQQQQQQQLQNQHQQAYQVQQQQQQQQSHEIQQNNQQLHNNHHQIEEQREKQHQQQMMDQQMHQMQMLPNHHHHTQQPQEQQQQQHYHNFQQPQQYQNHQQPQAQLQQQHQEQQQYQNHPNVVDDVSYGNGELSLDAKCFMHESSTKDLTKLASYLRGELERLDEELKMIKKEVPDYTVSEERI